MVSIKIPISPRLRAMIEERRGKPTITDHLFATTQMGFEGSPHLQNEVEDCPGCGAERYGARQARIAATDAADWDPQG